MSRRGPGGPAVTGKRLPTTLAAMMDLASKEPAEFARVREGGNGRKGFLFVGQEVLLFASF